MTPTKKAPAQPAAPARTEPAAETGSKGRKPWIRRTPVEVVLAQIGKQEERVAELRAELAREERELEKLEGAKKVLEAK